MSGILNAGSGKPLYSNTLNVNVSGLASDITRTRKLTLTVEWLPNSTPLKKVLAVHLTDSNDPFFYYMANIREDDFLKIKHEQELLVDFDQFPEAFTYLLNQCLTEGSKFILSLYMNANVIHGTSMLDIIERNPFKRIVHLSIRVSEVSDLLQKQHITSCYCNMKERKERVESILSSIQNELQNCQKSSSSKVYKPEDLVKRENDELYMKEQMIKNEIRQLKDVLSKECTDKLHQKDKMIRELKLKSDSLKAACQGKQNCIQSREKENEELQNLIEMKDKKIIRLSRDFHSSQIEVDEKEEVNNRLHRHLESVLEEKKHLEQQFFKLKSQNLMDEEKIKELQYDVHKGAEVCCKYVNQAREMQVHFKAKSKTIHKQDKVIERCSKCLENLKEMFFPFLCDCSDMDKHEINFSEIKKEVSQLSDEISRDYSLDYQYSPRHTV